MGVISFASEDDGRDWVKAGWVFRGVLVHARGRCAGDSELVRAIDEAMALDGLHLPMLAAGVSRRLLPVLAGVVDDIGEGALHAEVEGRVLDAVSQDQFREATQQLRMLIAAYMSSRPK